MGTRTILFALAFLLAGSLPAMAEGAKSDAPGKSPEPAKREAARERTLSTLIEDILRNGRSKTLDKHTSGNIGLGNTPTPMSYRQYPSSKTADGWSHGMGVFSKENEGVRATATSVVWMVTKVTKLKQGRHLEGRVYRFSPEGKLLNAMTATGIVGKLKHKRISITSQLVKNAFQKEIDFWLKDMAGVEYE